MVNFGIVELILLVFGCLAVLVTVALLIYLLMRPR